MSLYKSDGKQRNQFYSITHPYGPLRHCMTSPNSYKVTAILTFFWSHKHTLALLCISRLDEEKLMCRGLFFCWKYIYFLSVCACYPITKTPGMSLFHSYSQREIENSIKGLCSAYLKASLSPTHTEWIYFLQQNTITHPSTCLTLCPLHQLSPNPFPSLPPQGRVWLMGLGTPSRCCVPNRKV